MAISDVLTMIGENICSPRFAGEKTKVPGEKTSNRTGERRETVFSQIMRHMTSSTGTGHLGSLQEGMSFTKVGCDTVDAALQSNRKRENLSKSLRLHSGSINHASEKSGGATFPANATDEDATYGSPETGYRKEGKHEKSFIAGGGTRLESARFAKGGAVIHGGPKEGIDGRGRHDTGGLLHSGENRRGTDKVSTILKGCALNGRPDVKSLSTGPASGASSGSGLEETADFKGKIVGQWGGSGQSAKAVSLNRFQGAADDLNGIGHFLRDGVLDESGRKGLLAVMKGAAPSKQRSFEKVEDRAWGKGTPRVWAGLPATPARTNPSGLKKGSGAVQREKNAAVVEFPRGDQQGVERGKIVQYLKGQECSDHTMIVDLEAGQLPSRLESANQFSSSQIALPAEDMTETHDLPKVKLQGVIDHVALGLGKKWAKGFGRVRIELHPPQLGTLDMDVIVRNNKVHVMLVTPHEDVRQLLQSNMEQLKTSLHTQGLIADAVTVSLEERSEGNAHDFGRGGMLFRDGKNNGEDARDRTEERDPLVRVSQLLAHKTAHAQTPGQISLFA